MYRKEPPQKPLHYLKWTNKLDIWWIWWSSYGLEKTHCRLFSITSNTKTVAKNLTRSQKWDHYKIIWPGFWSVLSFRQLTFKFPGSTAAWFGSSPSFPSLTRTTKSTYGKLFTFIAITRRSETILFSIKPFLWSLNHTSSPVKDMNSDTFYDSSLRFPWVMRRRGVSGQLWIYYRAGLWFESC